MSPWYSAGYGSWYGYGSRGASGWPNTWGKKRWWSTQDENRKFESRRQAGNWWKNPKLVNCSSNVEAVGQGGGEAQMVEVKRKERIQELETLVAMLWDSIHLEDYKQKATEEMNLLKKKGVDKRPLAQQVASMNIWIERESKRININQEELDRGRQALEKQKAHFDKEMRRLEKLKAELPAAPIATPLNSEKGMEDDDEMLMDVTEEGLRRMKDEELELRRMVASKAGSNGEKLSVKRVQGISKQADEISASLKKRQCKKDVRKEGEQEVGKWLGSPTTRLDMVSWNLAGLPAGELDTFVVHVSFHMMWDALTIQESFRKQEGLNSGGHELYTALQLTKGNLRCPAILIHQRWKGQSTCLNGGTRWLAVSLWNTVTILSAHLPHNGCKISDYQDTLSEVHSVLEKRPKGALLLGMDCNVSLAGVVNRDLIGEAVINRSGRILSAQEKERQALLVEFMEEHSLMACNTWQNTEHSELMCTRQAWSDGQKAQIDFIMASQDWYLQDTWIDQYTHAATDHRPVCAVLSTSSSSPTVSEIQIREREDGINSDTSPVQVSTSVDDRSGQPDETQANNIQKPNKKKTTIERCNPLDSEIQEWLQ